MAELTPFVAAGLERARDRIASAGGDPATVRIVAVTKGFGPEAITAAVGAGCGDIGESYAQELVAKAAALDARVMVHFLGGLQRNKLNRLVPLVHLWQSIDRVEIAEALARRSPGARVLVQVDLLSGALPGRAGALESAVPPLVERSRELGLEVAGLMAVGPPPPADPEPAFRRLADQARSLGLAELSMGMSGDLEAAVRAGTTMLRLGTALFGTRQLR